MTQIPFTEVRAWMFRDAFPFWAEHGVDREFGGFLEELGLDGQPTACSFKRVRVICRQIYVFSQAAALGWSPGLDLSRLGYEYLLEKARRDDGAWARVLSRSGDVIDDRPDLYDLAFVLFALAWRYRVSGDPEVMRRAHETLDFLHQRMRASEGFVSILPDDGARLQNPHMHLLEACLAAFDASGEERFLDQAGELVGLFRRRLFDGRSLGERFTPAWIRIGESAGAALEPGHHFEWAWILSQYQRLKGVDLGRDASALVDWAETCGVDPQSHAVFDSVGEDCAPARTTSRAWTNTERIKAWLALFEVIGRDPRSHAASSASLLFERYFAGMRPGLWIDQFDDAGKPLSKAVPASVLYHIVFAFAELLRLESRLTAMDRSPP